MFNAIAGWLFKVSGWRIVGPTPTVPKALWVVAPHNTNWDFPIGLGVRPTLGIWIQYLAKKELFNSYAGWLFRALGGIPVDRGRATRLVFSVADLFASRESLHLCITPEGTRGNVKTLKTGFYFMAQKANVPLILTGFDWPRKLVILSEPLYVTGDYVKDMEPFYRFFSQVHGPKKDWLTDWEKTGIIPNQLAEGRPKQA